MSFTIYSIGDVNFLAEIINAVAMITAVPDFNKLIQISLLIGVIFVMIQSVFQGARQINWHQVFLGWIMYMAFFVPTTTVTLLDSYTSTARVISNVPMVIGVAGGVISRIGYGITRMFEQGYGNVDFAMTNRRFADSLQILNKVRRQGTDIRLFEALNKGAPPGADMRKSWYNYLNECAVVKLALGDITLEDMYAKNWQEAFRFETMIFPTEIYTGGAPQTMLCEPAFNELVAVSQNSMNQPAFRAALNRIIGASIDDMNLPGSRITNALQSLNATQTAGAAMDQAHAYVLASMLEPLYHEAVAGHYNDMQDYASAMMVNQALMQRNTQWAAEQTMFMAVVRPMVTFFEGFIYAITPVMAFLLVLGAVGIGLAGKYFLVLFWIQLWMPVLSIVNLFINTAAAWRIGQLNSDNFGMTSMYALSTGSDILQNWIATGGMLAAATPIIALFIVTGSSYAFTHLAGRINGADHINERMASPDVAEPSPLIKQLPNSTQDPMVGMARTGAGFIDTKYSTGDTLNKMESSTRGVMVQDSVKFGETLRNSITENASSEQIASRIGSFSSMLSSSKDNTVSMVNSAADSVVQSSGLNTAKANAVADIVKTGVTFSASKGLDFAFFKAGVQASLEKSGQSMSTNEVKDLYDRTVKAGESLNLNDAQQAGMNRAIAQNITDSNGESFRNSIGYKDDHVLAKDSARLESSSQSWQEATSRANSMGQAINYDGREFASQIQGEDARRLHEWVQWQKPDAQDDIESRKNLYTRNMNLAPEVAYKKAASDALFRKMANGDRNATELYGSIFSSIFGRETPAVGDYRENDRLKNNASDHANLPEDVSRAVMHAGSLNAADRVGVVAKATAPISDKEKTIVNDHQHHVQGVQTEHVNAQQAMWQSELNNQSSALDKEVQDGLSFYSAVRGNINNHLFGERGNGNRHVLGVGVVAPTNLQGSDTGYAPGNLKNGNANPVSSNLQRDPAAYLAVQEAESARRVAQDQKSYVASAKSLGMGDDMARAVGLVRGGRDIEAHNHLATTMFREYVEYEDSARQNPRKDENGRLIVQGVYGKALSNLVNSAKMGDAASSDISRAYLSRMARYEQAFNKAHGK